MSIVLRNLGFEWPNGQIVFESLSLSLENKIYGLVGPNGVGKSTLAKLMTKELEPTEGSVLWSHQGPVHYFAQTEEPPAMTIAEYLLDVLDSQENFVLKVINELPMDQLCQSLSGGEWTMVRLARAAGLGSSFLILDEPTNHLDLDGQTAIHEFLEQVSGGILLISHDRSLLEKCDQILELSTQGLQIFGGNWSVYKKQRDQESEVLFRNLETAKQERKKTALSRKEKIEKQEKRQKRGKEKAPDSGIPKIILGAMKRKAEVTRGQIEKATSEDLNQAVSSAWEAYQSLKIDPVMYAQLPTVELHSTKMVMSAEDLNFRFENASEDLWKENLNFSFYGPVRIAIRGENGSGKSTLLKLLKKENLRGQLKGNLNLGQIKAYFQDQNHDDINPDQSIEEIVNEAANRPQEELYNLLAMFLFKGHRVRQQFKELSGGEQLRTALAKALLSTPPAQALFLDEPTNHLDIGNIEFLEDLLRQYKGALIVVSHDQSFLKALKLTDEIHLKTRTVK